MDCGAQRSRRSRRKEGRKEEKEEGKEDLVKPRGVFVCSCSCSFSRGLVVFNCFFWFDTCCTSSLRFISDTCQTLCQCDPLQSVQERNRKMPTPILAQSRLVGNMKSLSSHFALRSLAATHGVLSSPVRWQTTSQPLDAKELVRRQKRREEKRAIRKKRFGTTFAIPFFLTS